MFQTPPCERGHAAGNRAEWSVLASAALQPAGSMHVAANLEDVVVMDVHDGDGLVRVILCRVVVGVHDRDELDVRRSPRDALVHVFRLGRGAARRTRRRERLFTRLRRSTLDACIEPRVGGG